MTEEWRFIPGLHERYSISNLGNVRKNAYYRPATAFIGHGTVAEKSVPVKLDRFAATNPKNGKRSRFSLSDTLFQVWGIRKEEFSND